MDFKTFFVKKILMSFFISVTCICAVMAILGLLYEPDARFGYEAMFFPLLFGAIAIFPSIITYSKKELPLKQTLLRKFLHLIILEGLIMLVLYSGGALKNAETTVSLVISILLVDLTVHFVLWLNDRKVAKDFNSALKAMQQRYELVD